MDLYYDGDCTRIPPGEFAEGARQRAHVRRAQRWLNQEEERRDVAFLVEAGLPLSKVADTTMLTRYRVSQHLAAWSRRLTRRRHAQEQRAQEVIAWLVVGGDFDDKVVDHLADVLAATLTESDGSRGDDGPVDGSNNAVWAGVRAQVDRGHEAGILDASQVSLLRTAVSRREIGRHADACGTEAPVHSGGSNNGGH